MATGPSSSAGRPLSISAQQGKPNIVYILVDNWGWGDVRIQGGSIPTPRIDTMAEQGLRFTNFNVESQCVPTDQGFDTWFGIKNTTDEGGLRTVGMIRWPGEEFEGY